MRHHSSHAVYNKFQYAPLTNFGCRDQIKKDGQQCKKKMSFIKTISMRCIFVYKHTETTKPFSCPATHHHQRSVNSTSDSVENSTSDSVEKYVFSLHHLTNDTKEMKKKTPSVFQNDNVNEILCFLRYT